ncbi:MAG: hypothetical protein AB7S36_08335 [Planctomycetota bacterium]
MSDTLPAYRYRGARAMVLLHEQHLREFVATWRQAVAAGVRLPASDDPDYASLEHLLVHVLACARGYMVWCCEVLKLPDPQIRPAPGADVVAAQANDFVEAVVAGWRAPLADIEEPAFGATYVSRWGWHYSVDSMLEHAVMHPIRHTFQLRELMAG